MKWTKAKVGCYWHSDSFAISTMIELPVRKSGYRLFRNRVAIATFPTLEMAQAHAEALLTMEATC